MCGMYGKYIFPWLMDWLLRGEKFAKLRSKVLADASGVVVEIGFGTGLNLAHYGPHVVRLFAVEPVDDARDKIQGGVIRELLL